LASLVFPQNAESLSLALQANYSVKWTAAMGRDNLTRTVAAATYLKRYASREIV
jgi:hypothetical protein